MDSWSLRGHRLLQGKWRIVVVGLAIALIVVACKSAATVFLDLPPEEETAEATQTAESRSGAGGQVDEDAGPRPPIEDVNDPDSVLALLPKAEAGYIDWMAALREGVIRPRWSLPGGSRPRETTGFQYDFLLKGMSPEFDAYFPHSAHVEWSSCQSCHPGIFPYRNAEITMDAINQGELCGRCHNRIAFPATACARCHRELDMPETPVSAELVADVIMARATEAEDTTRSSTGSYPPSVFPHWSHRIRYRCSACHPSPFEPRARTAAITMKAIQRGDACGACHNGETAFGSLQCNRCHYTPADAVSDSVP